MIAVLTCRRPGGVSYLADTLADIDRSATGNRVVISDCADFRPEVPEPWDLISFDRPLTDRPANKWALWRAMQIASMAGEDLIVLEDDVKLCGNGARYMERFAVPGDVGLVSFYDPYGDERFPFGLWRSKMHVFMFAQALKIPLRSCQTLARTEMDHRRLGSDDALQVVGEFLGWTYAIHAPSIVQHVGVVSAVGHAHMEDGRTSLSFRGTEWNALQLRSQQYD